MKYSHTQFKIDQLRKDKLILSVESVSVFLFALFISAFLPQLVFQYFYADQQLLEEPIIFQYIPVAAFVIGVGYFLYATLLILAKRGKIRKLEQELEMMSDDCCCGSCDDDDMKQMQDIVDELLEETGKPKTKTTKRKTKTAKKKATRKTTKK